MNETTRRTIQVTEGRARLQVPHADGPVRTRGPGKVEQGLFFNAAMRFNRDLSILVIEERAAALPSEHPYRVYDGLAATGARGLRIALECRAPRTIEVHLNDRDPGAARLLTANITENTLGDRVHCTNDDFVHALGTARYHHIDIDPYGSPVPFLDASVQHLAGHGTLAVTATDVTALCGVYPTVARRRYDSVPWHGPAMHEVALRILAGTAVRNAARYDVALCPILAHATDHYVRVYLTARKGARRADAALGQIGHAAELADGTRLLLRNSERPADARRYAGPLWTGPLQDAALVPRLLTRLEAHPQLEQAPLRRFLERAAEEADAPPLHYEMGETARRLRMSPPSMQQVLRHLRETGHQATRTHIADDAFKTDAPAAAIEAAFRQAARPT